MLPNVRKFNLILTCYLFNLAYPPSSGKKKIFVKCIHVDILHLNCMFNYSKMANKVDFVNCIHKLNLINVLMKLIDFHYIKC